jgi:hypothetical protein
MIDPASSWFEIVELPVITDAIIPLDTKGCKGKKTHKQPKLAYFDKSSAMISNLVKRPSLVSIHVVNISIMTIEANPKFTLMPYVNHLRSSVSQPVSRTHEQTLY